MSYDSVLRLAKPRPEQLAWRIGRFDRGLRLFAELAARIGPLAGKRLLDLGAAHGGDTAAAVAAGMSVTMADFRDHGYAALISQLSPFAKVNAELFDFNGEWPLPANAYDAVIALAVVEHICDLGGFFGKLARVLRPGGFAVIQTAMAFNTLHCDPFFGSLGTSVLPMPVRRFVCERLLGRRYSCPTLARTYYSARPILRGAARAGLGGAPHKYADSPIMARVRRWPLSRLWQRAARMYATDYILLIHRGYCEPPTARRSS